MTATTTTNRISFFIRVIRSGPVHGTWRGTCGTSVTTVPSRETGQVRQLPGLPVDTPITTPGPEMLLGVLRPQAFPAFLEERIDGRHEHQRDHRRRDEPADDDARQRRLQLSAFADAERHRHQA